jgi:hypothetical protein
MTIKTGIISAIAGTTLLGGAGVAALLSGGGGATTATFLAAPASATATAAAPTPAPADCNVRDDGSWPAFATGRPAGLDAGDVAGVYLWHDDAGWHLRVTHRNDNHQVYTGVLTTSGTFADVTAVKLEGNDHFEVGPNDHVVSFRFNNYGGVDGLDFHTHCAPRITFQLKADGQELETSHVFIGHDGSNPTSVPFVVERAR